VLVALPLRRRRAVAHGRLERARPRLALLGARVLRVGASRVRSAVRNHGGELQPVRAVQVAQRTRLPRLRLAQLLLQLARASRLLAQCNDLALQSLGVELHRSKLVAQRLGVGLGFGQRLGLRGCVVAAQLFLERSRSVVGLGKHAPEQQLVLLVLLQRAHLLGDDVGGHLRADILGVVGKLERRERFRDELRRRRGAAHDCGAAVAYEGGLQQLGELRAPKVDKALLRLGGQVLDDQAEREQGEVDVAALLEPHAVGVREPHALRTCQVHERQPAAHRRQRRAGFAGHLQREQRVRARRARVHVRAADVPPRLALVKRVDKGVVRGNAHHVDSRGLETAVGRVAHHLEILRAGNLLQRQQVAHLFIVDFHIRHCNFAQHVGLSKQHFAREPQNARVLLGALHGVRLARGRLPVPVSRQPFCPLVGTIVQHTHANIVPLMPFMAETTTLSARAWNTSLFVASGGNT